MSAKTKPFVVTQRFAIINERGLHARASAKFVETVNHFESEVVVSKDDMVVDGGSILDLMMLAASPGCSIFVEARGSDAAEVIEALEELVASRFGEGS